MLLPEDEKRIKEIISESLAGVSAQSDRVIHDKLLQIIDGRNIQLGRTLGTILGTAADQKLGFFGKTAVTQRLKASYNNFASLVDLENALVALGLIDAAGAAPAAAAYGGKVISGSATLPAGWSMAVDSGTHIYTITHNLGVTTYSVVALPASFALQANLLSHGSTTFTIEFDNSSGTAFTTDWDFALIPIV